MRINNVRMAGAGLDGLAQYITEARSRPCLACGTAGEGGLLTRCVERFADAPRLLLMAVGSRHELGIVPVFSDGSAMFGCADLEQMVLLRPPALRDTDAAAQRVVQNAGGRLWIADSYEDAIVQGRIQEARGVLAWDVNALYPVADAGVVHEPTLPRRTVGESTAPRYGRWPAPWLHWRSVSDWIPWHEQPFRKCARGELMASPSAALAAVGLPALGPDVHPLAEALAVATLLRSPSWRGHGRALGARLLPVPEPAMAFVAVYRGEAYRLAFDGAWEPLFVDGPPDRPITLRDVERAAGHLRMVDVITRPGD